MSMVSIAPQTVKQERIQKGYRTQEAAVAKSVEVDQKGEGLSARQWSRIEAAKKPLVRVRRGTAELIAKTLGGLKVEDLGKPPANEADVSKTMQEAGYRRISLWLGKDVRLNYRWVTHHYDVSVQDLIDAAPWMFTLLAEMSLADRRSRLDAANNAFEDAMRLLPKHLDHGKVACSDFDHAHGDEQDSLAGRDVFGKIVLETEHGADPFDPRKTNPFIEFLRKLAADIGSAEIDREDLELSYSGMPRWHVFQNWLHELTGGDDWARFAVENVKGVIHAIPDDRKGKEKTAERVQWLIEQIPAEMKAREEERRAKAAADLEAMGIKL